MDSVGGCARLLETNAVFAITLGKGRKRTGQGGVKPNGSRASRCQWIPPAQGAVCRGNAFSAQRGGTAQGGAFNQRLDPAGDQRQQGEGVTEYLVP